MATTKYRYRINRNQLDTLEECRALLLQSLIKQGEQEERECGYEPGELTDADRQELHDLLTAASDRWSQYKREGLFG